MEFYVTESSNKYDPVPCLINGKFLKAIQFFRKLTLFGFVLTLMCVVLLKVMFSLMTVCMQRKVLVPSYNKRMSPPPLPGRTDHEGGQTLWEN